MFIWVVVVVETSFFSFLTFRYTPQLQLDMNHGNIQQLLTPPEQFGIVEPGIYRSDMLQPLHFPFIKSIHFKTVVMLSPEMPNRVTSNLMDECGMKLVGIVSLSLLYHVLMNDIYDRFTLVWLHGSQHSHPRGVPYLKN